MHDKTYLLDWDSIIDRKYTKKRLVAHHYPPEKFTIDYALPQGWLNNVANNAVDLDYNSILFTCVWMYPSKAESPTYWLSGIPAVLCQNTAHELARQGIPFWTPRGYHGAKNNPFKQY